MLDNAAPFLLAVTLIAGQPQQWPGSNSQAEVDVEQRVTISINGELLEFTTDGDRVIDAMFGGDPIDPSNIIQGAREKGLVSFLDSQGETIYEYDIAELTGGNLATWQGNWNPRTGLGIRSQIQLVDPEGRLSRFVMDDEDLTNLGAAFQLSRQAAGINLNPPKVMMGVRMVSPSPDLVGHFQLDAEHVSVISDVYNDLPAEQAGLERFDIIVGVDDVESGSNKAVTEALRSKDVGQNLRLRILKRGVEKTITIDLAPYDAERLQRATPKAWEPAGGINTGALIMDMNDFRRDTEWLLQSRGLAEGVPGWSGPEERRSMDRLEERLERVELLLDSIRERLDQPHEPRPNP